MIKILQEEDKIIIYKDNYEEKNKIGFFDKNNQFGKINLSNIFNFPYELKNMAFFKDLKKLHINMIHVKKIDFLPNNLEYLSLTDGQIEVIQYLPINLIQLNLENNKLKMLPLIPVSLKRLTLKGNKFKQICLKDTNIEILSLSNNKFKNFGEIILPETLIELELDNNLIPIETISINLPIIKKITMRNNGIKNFDCSNSIQYLDLFNNKLTNISQYPNLLILNISKNNIKNLHLNSNKLEIIHCSSNLLNEIKNIPSSCKMLNINNNYIKELWDLPDNIDFLNCLYNPLEKIKIPKYCQKLLIDFDNIKYIKNIIKLKDIIIGNFYFEENNITNYVGQNLDDYNTILKKHNKSSEEKILIKYIDYILTTFEDAEYFEEDFNNTVYI